MAQQFSEDTLQQKFFVVGSSLMSKSAQRGAQDQRNAITRAADTDRIQVAQLLTDAAAQGQLQMSDYEDRLTKAYAAKTYEELDRLRSESIYDRLAERAAQRSAQEAQASDPHLT